MQVAIAGSFVALNFSYWCTAARRRTHSWKINDIFDVEEHHDQYSREESYTQCLFAAIRASGQSKWLKDINALPNTPQWNNWLDEADSNKHDAKWDAAAALKRLVIGPLSSTP